MVAYGVELVKTFLDTTPDEVTDPLRIEFRRTLSANFHPRGTHFDGFVARLYEFDDAFEPASFPGYAIGLRVADLPIRAQSDEREMSIRLERTVDCRDQQLQIVKTLYQAYEDFFVSAAQRFGESHRDALLPSCWDKFRHHIGLYLMRFRDPAKLQHPEWIAIALTRNDEHEDSIAFEVIDNRIVPLTTLPLTRANSIALQIDSVKVGAALPFEITKESLTAFLRHHGIFRVDIAKTQHFQ